MEYAILIYRDESETDVDWAQREADYESYFKAVSEAGVMRGGPRLQSSTTATTVAVRDGQRLITDGPFGEAREQLGGIFVLDCAHLDEALEWAARCPAASHGTIEVRPVTSS
jgi:hypothetical protein